MLEWTVYLQYSLVTILIIVPILIIAFLCCCPQRCCKPCRPLSARQQLGPATDSLGLKLTKGSIELRIPSHAYEGGHETGEDPSCSICMNDYVVGEAVRKLPCAHQFHAACVDTWFLHAAQKFAACPLCQSRSFAVSVSAFMTDDRSFDEVAHMMQQAASAPTSSSQGLSIPASIPEETRQEEDQAMREELRRERLWAARLEGRDTSDLKCKSRSTSTIERSSGPGCARATARRSSLPNVVEGRSGDAAATDIAIPAGQHRGSGNADNSLRRTSKSVAEPSARAPRRHANADPADDKNRPRQPLEPLRDAGVATARGPSSRPGQSRLSANFGQPAMPRRHASAPAGTARKAATDRSARPAELAPFSVVKRWVPPQAPRQVRDEPRRLPSFHVSNPRISRAATEDSKASSLPLRAAADLGSYKPPARPQAVKDKTMPAWYVEGDESFVPIDRSDSTRSTDSCVSANRSLSQKAFYPIK